MQTFSPLQSLFAPWPLLCSLHGAPPAPSSPAQSALPSPPFSAGRTYGTHFAGDIEEPPVRPPSLPPWRPRSRASPWPPSVAAPLPGHSAGSQSPERSAVPGRPGGGGPPASPERGASSAAPRAPPPPRGLEGRTKPGAGAGAGCGPRFRASPRVRPPVPGPPGVE